MQGESSLRMSFLMWKNRFFFRIDLLYCEKIFGKELENMRSSRKKFTYTMTAILLAVALTGCTNEKQENEDAYRQIGINCMAQKDYEGAVSAFDSALNQKIGKIGEEEIDICYYKAAAQYASGDTDGAIATYNALLDYDDTNADAYYLRGTMYLVLGDTSASQADFTSAVTNNSEDYELYVNIYEQLNGAGLTTEASGYLNQALEIKGDSAKDHLWKGRIYQLLAEYENAETELNAALEKKSLEANLYLAQIYEAQGDEATATTYYQTYLDSGEADSEVMYALGNVEMNKENYQGAISYFKSGLEMEEVTNEQELMQNLVIAYEKAGDFSSAKTMMEQYLENYPEDEAAQREYIFLCTR